MGRNAELFLGNISKSTIGYDDISLKNRYVSFRSVLAASTAGFGKSTCLTIRLCYVSLTKVMICTTVTIFARKRVLIVRFWNDFGPQHYFVETATRSITSFFKRTCGISLDLVAASTTVVLLFPFAEPSIHPVQTARYASQIVTML